MARLACELAQRCRRRVAYQREIVKEATLKDAHIYCVTRKVRPHEYGSLLEHYICTKHGFERNGASSRTGDMRVDHENAEVKVSIGIGCDCHPTRRVKFNWVQLRPTHGVHFYVLTAYHLAHENVASDGELYVFRVPKHEMVRLLVRYGGYAHGTKARLGKIAADDMGDETTSSTKEYALRPAYGGACWRELLEMRVASLSSPGGDAPGS
jgi:hypothetical protein